jgi:hypothetical protein
MNVCAKNLTCDYKVMDVPVKDIWEVDLALPQTTP